MTNNSSIDNQQQKGGNQLTPEQRKEELTKCILSQYRLCAAGTIGGAGFSVLRSQSVRPTAWPMLGGAVSSLFVWLRLFTFELHDKFIALLISKHPVSSSNFSQLVGTLGDFVYGYFVECASLRTEGDSLVGSNNDKKS